MARAVLLLAIFDLVLASWAQQNAAKPAIPAPKRTDDSQLYRNAEFGFRYRIPYGWVDRTKEMQEQDEQKGDESSSKRAGKEARKGDVGQVLLAVFERPPEAAGDTVNSAVIIASEGAASYPGLKSAEDYLAPLTELTTSNGFKPDGDPQEVTIDSRSLVRADFTKALNDKLAMYQSTLVLFQKKEIVSFTFIAGSKDEIDALMDALSFRTGGVGRRP